MGIYRVQKDSNYVVMNKTALQDARLSWKAKGLHAYMLSMPDDWSFYDTELQKHAKDGRDALKNAIKELKELGYMKRVRRRNNEGKFDYETLVFETPQSDLPCTENPLTEKPFTDNPKLLNNNELSNKELNNNTTTAAVENPFDVYQQNIGILAPIVAQDIGSWIDDLNEELVSEAIKIAAKNQKKWPYAVGILKDWYKNNVRSLNDVKASEQQFKQKKEQPKKPVFQTEGALAGMWSVNDYE